MSSSYIFSYIIKNYKGIIPEYEVQLLQKQFAVLPFILLFGFNLIELFIFANLINVLAVAALGEEAMVIYF